MGRVFLLDFASRKRRRKTGAQWIAFGSEKRYPALHDLRIAQIAQSREQRFRDGAELFPSGCGIDGAKTFSERAAAANRNPQVVHGISFQAQTYAIQFSDSALGPVQQADAAGFDVTASRGQRRSSFMSHVGCDSSEPR